MKQFGSPPTIRPAADARDFADIGLLMREYLTELGVDLCFQDFEGEVADLPRARKRAHRAVARCAR